MTITFRRDYFDHFTGGDEHRLGHHIDPFAIDGGSTRRP
jgi:hypothetical protein